MCLCLVYGTILLNHIITNRFSCKIYGKSIRKSTSGVIRHLQGIHKVDKKLPGIGNCCKQ